MYDADQERRLSRRSRIEINRRSLTEKLVLVLKNPYFAATDKEGKFSIVNDKAMKAAKVLEEDMELPAGKYIIKTWHEKLKTVSQEVTVPEEGEVEVELRLKRGRPDKELYPPEE